MEDKRSPQLGEETAAQEENGDAAGFRVFMRSFPSGVSVVTSTNMTRPFGFTCSSLCSVALDPPTLLVCARSDSATLVALRGSGRFAVNLLHDRGHHAARTFASGAQDRFDHVRWEPSPLLGLPYLVEDAHSVAECASVGYHEVGDHTVIIGEIQAVTCGRDTPLLYGFRRFAAWGSLGTDLGPVAVPKQEGTRC